MRVDAGGECDTTHEQGAIMSTGAGIACHGKEKDGVTEKSFVIPFCIEWAGVQIQVLQSVKETRRLSRTA